MRSTHRTVRAHHTFPIAFLLLGAAGACDRSPEANGGPRLVAVETERAPYPAVADLPLSQRAVMASAEHFVLVGDDGMLRLGTRGQVATTAVSLDDLLRAFWHLRDDPLGGRGAANPSSAPLVIAAAAVPASRVLAVVDALWQHGARIAIGGGLPGAEREHPVRLVSERALAPHQRSGGTVTLGRHGLELVMPGEKTKAFAECGPSPDTACLVRVLDKAAEWGARTLFLRMAGAESAGNGETLARDSY